MMLLRRRRPPACPAARGRPGSPCRSAAPCQGGPRRRSPERRPDPRTRGEVGRRVPDVSGGAPGRGRRVGRRFESARPVRPAFQSRPGCQPAHGRENGGNTPPCANRKMLGAKTAELALGWAFRAIHRDQPHAQRRPRNVGVSGSYPLVGFAAVPGVGSRQQSRFGPAVEIVRRILDRRPRAWRRFDSATRRKRYASPDRSASGRSCIWDVR